MRRLFGDGGRGGRDAPRPVLPAPRLTRRNPCPRPPQTPDVRAPCSKRAFDGQVLVWRRRLHAWDDEPAAAAAAGDAVDGGGAGAPALPPAIARRRGPLSALLASAAAAAVGHGGALRTSTAASGAPSSVSSTAGGHDDVGMATPCNTPFR